MLFLKEIWKPGFTSFPHLLLFCVMNHGLIFLVGNLMYDTPITFTSHSSLELLLIKQLVEGLLIRYGLSNVTFMKVGGRSFNTLWPF